MRHEEGIPNIVLIGLPNVAALRRALAKLEANQIPHFAWTEPDNNLGLTSITTAPIAGEQRKALANYRVYNARVAQLRECSALTGEAVGENPAACATTPSMEASVRV